MTGALVDLILVILNTYQWVVIAAVISSWLVNFNVINPRNEFVRMVLSALFALTEPVFNLVRRVIPPFGGLDLSPIVVLLGIFFLERLLVRWFYFGQIL